MGKRWRNAVAAAGTAGVITAGIGGYNGVKSVENEHAAVARAEQDKHIPISDEMKAFANKGFETDKVSEAMAAVNGLRQEPGRSREIAPATIYQELMNGENSQSVVSERVKKGQPLTIGAGGGVVVEDAILKYPTASGDIYAFVPKHEIGPDTSSSDKPDIVVYFHAKEKADGSVDLGRPAGTLTSDGLLNRSGDASDDFSQELNARARAVAAQGSNAQGAAR